MKNGSGFNLHPINWVTHVLVALQKNIIEAGVDPGIGGLVQTATLDKKGFKWLTHASRKKNDGSWSVTKRRRNSWRMSKEGKVIEKTERFLEDLE